MSVRFGKRLHRLGTLILCIRLIQLAGVFLLSILFKHLTVADDDDEQHNDEESSYFESEKEIEDMSARVPLLQAEEKCEDQDLQPRYVVFDEDSEDDGPDSYSELACQGITYQDMSDSADDDHESRINVA
ncbi:hypothetical protein BGW41_007379 [Actinomortierella wolfii]|nr:hypothetical protein BGW41_007379 [Actinomortierella wolfii]